MQVPDLSFKWDEVRDYDKNRSVNLYYMERICYLPIAHREHRLLEVDSLREDLTVSN